jgi:hypothetical protein
MSILLTGTGLFTLGFALKHKGRIGMRKLFFIACLTFSNTVSAASLCKDLFVSSSVSVGAKAAFELAAKSDAEHKDRIEILKDRLSSYFRQEWKSPEPLSDAAAARSVITKLELYGSLTDLAILETYVRILELTPGKFEARGLGFYVDSKMGVRAKSTHFQERHWDWSVLDGYFFNSPSSLTFSKERDLAYLSHVLQTALAHQGKNSLRVILQEANRSWALDALKSDPALRTGYLAFEKGRSYGELLSEFIAKVRAWAAEAKTVEQKHVRYRRVQMALRAFGQANSSFDLYLLNNYFDLTRALQTTAFKEEWKPPFWLQMTDWRVFEMGLPSGSIEYMSDFLFQNSHDMVAKIYLLRILTKMQTTVPRDLLRIEDGTLAGNDPTLPSFYFSFLEARERVDATIAKIVAPDIYESDLHIFSPNHQPGAGGADSLDHVLVQWNPTLGRLGANLVESFPVALNRNVTVASSPLLRGHVKRYFDNFRKDQTYTQKEIDIDENKELNAPLARSTFLVFTKPGRDQLLAMVRIYDGGLLDGETQPIFIEQDFPQLQLPERSQGVPIYEMGRLIATPEVVANSLGLIMSRVGEYFKNTSGKGVVYMDGNRVATTYYRRLGANIVYGPEQLGLKPDATPLWILKASVSQIMHQFVKPRYESVQLRGRSGS